MLEVGTKLCVKGAWDPSTASGGRRTIQLNPLGTVFGNPYHSSTRAFLDDLENLVSPGSVVVDVGTGAGTLAIGVALLGARKVYATDVNPPALKAAQENVVTNGVGATVEVFDGTFPEVSPGSVDLVVCNMDSGEFLILKVFPQVDHALKMGGMLAVRPLQEEMFYVEAAASLIGLNKLRSQGFREWEYAVFQRS